MGQKQRGTQKRGQREKKKETQTQQKKKAEGVEIKGYTITLKCYSTKLLTNV